MTAKQVMLQGNYRHMVTMQQLQLVLQKLDHLDGKLNALTGAMVEDLAELRTEQQTLRRLLGKLLLAFGNLKQDALPMQTPLNDADMALIRSWVDPLGGNGAAFRDD